MKRTIIFGIILSFLNCSSFYNDKSFASKSELTPGDFSIGSLKLGDQVNEKKIRSLFGNPIKIRHPHSNDEKEYDFKDLKVFTYKPTYTYDMFWKFEIIGGKYSTSRGVKVGDSLDIVVEKYGDDAIGDYETGFECRLSLKNTKNQSEYCIQFHSDDIGEIKEIIAFYMLSTKDACELGVNKVVF